MQHEKDGRPAWRVTAEDEAGWRRIFHVRADTAAQAGRVVRDTHRADYILRIEKES